MLCHHAHTLQQWRGGVSGTFHAQQNTTLYAAFLFTNETWTVELISDSRECHAALEVKFIIMELNECCHRLSVERYNVNSGGRK